MLPFRLKRLVTVLVLCALVCCEFGSASAPRKPRKYIRMIIAVGVHYLKIRYPSQPPPLPLGHLAPHAQRVVLVTGAAGFIGFHISRRLVTEWRVKQVVVVDSFNNYYDVQLKRDRATELVKMGVKVSV